MCTKLKRALNLEKGTGVPAKKKAKQNVTTSIKSKSQVIKDIKLKEIMAFAGVSLIESTSIPTESHAATPMQSDLINI